MNITQNLTTVNRTVTPNRKIQYIVIHYFGGLASAEQTCAYFKSVNRRASAHYFVDGGGVYQCVEDKYASWHCGDSGIGTHKSRCNNANSIGIEVRPYKVSTATMSAGDKDWYFDSKTVDNLVELVKSLMDKHGIDIDHVIRHYDVTAKLCPRPWVGDDVNTYYGKSGNQLWQDFKAKLSEGEEVKTKTIKANMNGKETPLTSIEYNGENYIRIRDLANAQTDDKLTVDWDAKTETVLITSK